MAFEFVFKKLAPNVCIRQRDIYSLHLFKNSNNKSVEILVNTTRLLEALWLIYDRVIIYILYLDKSTTSILVHRLIFIYGTVPFNKKQIFLVFSKQKLPITIYVIESLHIVAFHCETVFFYQPTEISNVAQVLHLAHKSKQLLV